MSNLTRRFMRLLVFFDLPTLTKEDKRAYTLFRRFLIQDGYDMIQWSVYGRIINGSDAREKHLQRLKSQLPPSGSVRALVVTEKQLSEISILVVKSKPQETMVTTNQLLLF